MYKVREQRNRSSLEESSKFSLASVEVKALKSGRWPESD